MQNVFHVSVLQRYICDPSHVIHPQHLEINEDLTYDELPVAILDSNEKIWKQTLFGLMRVSGRNFTVEDTTLETEDYTRAQYQLLSLCTCKGREISYLCRKYWC